MASTAFNFTSVRAELLMLLATSEHQNDPYSISQFLESPRGKAQHTWSSWRGTMPSVFIFLYKNIIE